MYNAERSPNQGFTNDLASDKPQEECGIIGVYAPNGNAVQMAYKGLEALQHRGQDGAGVSYYGEPNSITPPPLEVIKGEGRAKAIFDGGTRLRHQQAPVFATGHVRYSTSKTDDLLGAIQPLHHAESLLDLTVAHNGHFDSDTIAQLADEYEVSRRGTDSMVFTGILAASASRHGHIEPAMHEVLPKLEGAFCLSILAGGVLYAVKDRHAVRPLVLGKNHTNDATVIASEVDGLTAAGALLEKEVEPGTYLAISEHGIREQRWSKPDKKICIFEPIYLSKPTNVIDGKLVADYRYAAGVMLAEQMTQEENAIVVPVLGSAKVYAKGAAEASGLPYVEALEKIKEDRSFIINVEDIDAFLDQKFKVRSELVAGKVIKLYDDSLVRGKTMRKIVQLFKDAGAERVDVYIGSSKYQKPCKLGVNVQTEEELLAYGKTTEEMCDAIGADSLTFLEREDVLKAAQLPAEDVCDGCMGGTYPQTRKETDFLVA